MKRFLLKLGIAYKHQPAYHVKVDTHMNKKKNVWNKKHLVAFDPVLLNTVQFGSAVYSPTTHLFGNHVFPTLNKVTCAPFLMFYFFDFILPIYLRPYRQS